MGENIVTPEELEYAVTLAVEAHQGNVIAAREIDDLRIEHEQLRRYASSETVSLSEDVSKLSEFIELMYNVLGVPIRDSDGRLRDVADVSHDLHSLNPKITLTFQELMQFEGEAL